MQDAARPKQYGRRVGVENHETTDQFWRSRRKPWTAQPVGLSGAGLRFPSLDVMLYACGSTYYNGTVHAQLHHTVSVDAHTCLHHGYCMA